MRTNKWIKILLWTVIILRGFPLFAYIYFLFEPDPHYLEILEQMEVFSFVNSIFFMLLSVLIFLFCYKNKMGRFLWLVGSYVFMELCYLIHHFSVLFTTDHLNTTLATFGVIIVPFTIYKLSKKEYHVKWKWIIGKG